MSNQNPNQTITIKKYANRRLYNTATSSYVTLQDLSVMVKDGVKFNVYDAKSSEDITRSVLTQIIVDEENKGDQTNLLPIDFLRQLIGFYGSNLQWMVPKYLEHSLNNLSDNQEKIAAYFQNSLGSIFPFGTTFEEMGKQNMALFENVLRMFSPTASFNALNTLGFGKTAATDATGTTTTASSTATTTATTSAATPPVSAMTQPFQVSADTGTTTTTASTSASVTSLKPRQEASAKITTTTATMPHVQAAVAANSSAEDMQQKIANLQRQLADLAKSRA
ncbi:MAG: polyhydroxyalkanoate synthesis repressor PhaR [Alphaproteobacteria bacterium]|nr:polyhydroxyalkanoate synthesis repressor PhaR [Alphaproteobacteria bacterium]